MPVYFERLTGCKLIKNPLKKYSYETNPKKIRHLANYKYNLHPYKFSNYIIGHP